MMDNQFKKLILYIVVGVIGVYIAPLFKWFFIDDLLVKIYLFIFQLILHYFLYIKFKLYK